MLKIGLTGGIGCGKSTVTQLFTQLNVPIIDADSIAHQLVSIGKPALKLIQQQFGDNSLNIDGSLNRTYVRDTIFTNPIQKQKLESLLHPLIYQQIEDDIAMINAPYCIISIPLLFETQKAHLVHRVLVVDCSIETQLERVKQRDNSSFEKIHAIIKSQVSREFRKNHADDLIDNSIDSTNSIELEKQVNKLHHLYLSLSNT